MAGKIILSIVLVIIVLVLIFVLVWGIGVWSFATTWAREWNPAKWAADNMDLGGDWSNWRFNIGGVNAGGGNSLGKDAKYGLEFETAATGISEIALNFVDEDVEVVAGTGNNIRIEQVGAGQLADEDLMRFGVLGNVLIAESGKLYNNDWSIGVLPHSTIRVHIPAGVEVKMGTDTASGKVSVDGATFQDLAVDTASGEVELASVTGAAVKVDTASGDVHTQKISCDSFEVNTASGTVDVAGDATERFSADTASGSVKYTGSTKDFKANVVSGSVEAVIPAGLEYFEVDSASGSVTLDCGDAKDLKKVDVDTVSGGVKIILPQNDGFALDYDSASGSVKSDFDMRPRGEGKYESGNGKIEIEVDTASGGLQLIKG